MDLGPLVVLVVAALLVAFGAGRALATLGLASDVMASLFVPPDRRLGWPHGVQEQDVSWTWRPSTDPAEDDDPPAPVATQALNRSPIHEGSAIRR